MQEPDFSYRSQECHPFAIVKLAGQFARAHVHELKHEANRLIAYNGCHYLVLDMVGVTFLDSGAIGVVMFLFEMCKKQGGRLSIVAPQTAKPLHSLYQASLQKFIGFHPSVQMAVKDTCDKLGLPLPQRLFLKVEHPEEPREVTAEDRLDMMEMRIERIEHLLMTLQPHAAHQTTIDKTPDIVYAQSAPTLGDEPPIDPDADTPAG
jgi:anti-anti-sigma factor